MDSKQIQLVELSFALYERELTSATQLFDYSFIVFPIAKAYEGFLKQYLFDLELIDKKTYEGKKFRIGRALNPDVHMGQRDLYWLFDDLSQLCGEQVAHDLWLTWLECRNRVFHYYPNSENALSLAAAKEKIDMVVASLDAAVTCRVSLV